MGGRGDSDIEKERECFQNTCMSDKMLEKKMPRAGFHKHRLPAVRAATGWRQRSGLGGDTNCHREGGSQSSASPGVVRTNAPLFTKWVNTKFKPVTHRQRTANNISRAFTTCQTRA